MRWAYPPAPLRTSVPNAALLLPADSVFRNNINDGLPMLLKPEREMFSLVNHFGMTFFSFVDYNNCVLPSDKQRRRTAAIGGDARHLCSPRPEKRRINLVGSLPLSESNTSSPWIRFWASIAILALRRRSSGGWADYISQTMAVMGSTFEGGSKSEPKLPEVNEPIQT